MFLKDSFLQKENGFPLHKSLSIEMKMHEREIFCYWHWKGRSTPLLWVQISKIIRSQELISINPNTHPNRGAKIVPRCCDCVQFQLCKRKITLVHKLTTGFSPTSSVLRSAPMPWQRPAASREPSRRLPLSWCPRATGSPAPSGHCGPASAHSSPKTRSSAESFARAHWCLRPASTLQYLKN